MAEGLVVVDKPAGWTSHDVVAKLRGVFGQRRVGHAGTLDPDATGVLLVGVGRVTRLLRFLSAADKEYRGTVVFGVATDTLDAAGAVLERTPMSVNRTQLEPITRRFVGDIEQIPPMVSAVKVGGRRLHELARQGIEVERAPRPVHIARIDVEELVPGSYPEAVLRVVCSSGTYIRTLAADLGAALGGCAHLRDLRRLRIGSFTLSEARSLDAIAADPEAALLPPAAAVRDLPARRLGPDEARAVAHGATFAARVLVAEDVGDGPFAMLSDDGELLAVYERKGKALKPTVVLADAGERAS
ncbi:MAG TPA: tRNA pseudouridine(55) synthase TruB [Acidimicrobiia bacterium]|nr:tRNA pseudouridine(55) synthase TruB [Acidimicrobiia bacterium]